MTGASRTPLGQGLGAGAERAAEEPLLAGIGERDAAVRASEDVAALDAEQRGRRAGSQRGRWLPPARAVSSMAARRGRVSGRFTECRACRRSRSPATGRDHAARLRYWWSSARRRSPPRAWRTAAAGGCPRWRPVARAARASGCAGRRAACGGIVLVEQDEGRGRRQRHEERRARAHDDAGAAGAPASHAAGRADGDSPLSSRAASSRSAHRAGPS